MSYVNKEMTLLAHLLVESFCIAFQEYILQQVLRLSLVLHLLLIFYQIAGFCSSKIVLFIEKRVYFIVTLNHCLESCM